MAPHDDAADEADRLQRRWQRLAASPHRDYYVASHGGWSEGATWNRHAEFDVIALTWGVDEDWLRGQHVLEIGCGVGRLAPVLAPRVRSYTGFDIAPGMVAEARARASGDPGVRFFEADGTTVPAGARDRSYGFVFSHAVLIHCPLAVIEALLQSCGGVLARGGVLRLQLRADATDPTGIEPAPDILPPHAPPDSTADLPTDAQLEADVDDVGGYMGHAFGFAEARDFLRALGLGPVTVRRFDQNFVYAWITREAEHRRADD